MALQLTNAEKISMLLQTIFKKLIQQKMKKIIFMSVAIVLANILFAQAANKTNDLQNVQHVFSGKYPNAELQGKWKQNDSNYFCCVQGQG